MSAVLAVSLFPIGQQWAMRAGNNADLYPEKISILILLNSLYRQIRNRTNGSHQSTPRRSHGQLLLSRSSRMLIFDNPDYERVADRHPHDRSATTRTSSSSGSLSELSCRSFAD